MAQWSVDEEVQKSWPRETASAHKISQKKRNYLIALSTFKQAPSHGTTSCVCWVLVKFEEWTAPNTSFMCMFYNFNFCNWLINFFNLLIVHRYIQVNMYIILRISFMMEDREREREILQSTWLVSARQSHHLMILLRAWVVLLRVHSSRRIEGEIIFYILQTTLSTLT